LDSYTGETDREGVFAAGDGSSRAAALTGAVIFGGKCTIAADRYLKR